MARVGSTRAPGETVDVVILTVIQAEFEAARRVLQIGDHNREKDPDGTVYFRGTVRSDLVRRDYTIALTCIGAAGNPNAAAATAGAIAKYHPRAVLLMGIAAGVRGKVQIGEVVLSDRVVTYEPAALVRSAKGTEEQPRPEIDRAPYTIIQDMATYRPILPRLLDTFVRAGGVIPTAATGQEDEFRAHVASTVTARLGTIASGEKLLRNPEKLLAVRKLHGKTEVGEMEAAGFVEACRRGPVPWLVIRGISDFGDEFKDDRFHAFASCAAAAVAHDFVAHGIDLGATSSRATELARPRATNGAVKPREPRRNAPSIEDLRIGWDDELEQMEELVEDAQSYVSIARELDGWEIPFWTTRRRQLASHYDHNDWWISAIDLYTKWKEARRNFPTTERLFKPTMATRFRLERAIDTLRSAGGLVSHIRRCLATEAEISTLTELDRQDAIRICLAGAESGDGVGYGEFAAALGIPTDSVACRLAVAAWNVSSHAEPRDQDKAAAKLLRSGWVPTTDVMMLEGASASRAYDRLIRRKRPARKAANRE
jgi:nucleoside phosphorylase